MATKRDPWWVQRARFLKHQAKPRWKPEDIAIELGRTLPEIRQALGIVTPYAAPIEPPRRSADKRSYERNVDKDDAAQAKRDRNRRKVRKCERCGQPLSSPKVKALVCSKCKSDLWTAKIEEAVRLWNTGMSSREVGEHMGEQPNTVGALITFGRERGLEARYANKKEVSDEDHVQGEAE